MILHINILYFDNLVDSASSHTLVSKIKPCMSKYKHYIINNIYYIFIYIYIYI